METTSEFILLLMLIALLPAYIAYKKGRRFFLWWLYGMAIFIIALPHAIIAKPKRNRIEKRLLKNGMKKCPFCAEIIKQEALVCPNCLKELNLPKTIEITDLPITIEKTDLQIWLENNPTKSINDYYQRRI